MLKHLQVANLALVAEARVDFQSGLNVISGETGAGKSLLIGALNLALGERADKRVVRAGAEQCAIEAVFHLADAAAIDAMLEDAGLPACAAGEIILRRIISAAGAGRQFINDRAVTLQIMKRAGDCLADMHGPHEHQSLLDPRAQLELLDAYGRLGKLRAAHADAYADYDKRRRELRDLETRPDVMPPDWLAAQVRELEAAGLSETEEAELLAEQKILGNAHRILELAGVVEQRLNDGGDCAINALAAARKALEPLLDLAAAPSACLSDLDAALTHAREVAREVGALTRRVECDPARLAQIEQRLALYQKLKHKYGGSVAAAQSMMESARAELEAANRRRERLAALAAQVEKALQAVLAVGMRLRAGRQKAGVALARAAGRELAALEMAGAEFAARLAETPPCATGLDAVEFEFSANAGEPAHDLRRVASSGEMSRVMLALKSVLAQQDRVPVLVFDEIDVNLGGRAAGVVGRKLRALARHHQVLCITHLPQVAACGDAHFVVRKEARRQRVVTDVMPLDRSARIEEIARMLGGGVITDVTRAHAAEMLARNSAAD